MNKNVNQIVVDSINQNICDVMDNFQSNEKIEELCDLVHKQTGEEIEESEMKKIVDEKIKKLSESVSKYVSELMSE